MYRRKFSMNQSKRPASGDANLTVDKKSILDAELQDMYRKVRDSVDLETGASVYRNQPPTRRDDNGVAGTIEVTPEEIERLMEMRAHEASAHLRTHFGGAEKLCVKLGSHPLAGESKVRFIKYAPFNSLHLHLKSP